MYNCEAIHELCQYVDIAKYSFATVLGFFCANKQGKIQKAVLRINIIILGGKEKWNGIYCLWLTVYYWVLD